LITVGYTDSFPCLCGIAWLEQCDIRSVRNRGNLLRVEPVATDEMVTDPFAHRHDVGGGSEHEASSANSCGTVPNSPRDALTPPLVVQDSVGFHHKRDSAERRCEERDLWRYPSLVNDVGPAAGDFARLRELADCRVRSLEVLQARSGVGGPGRRHQTY